MKIGHATISITPGIEAHGVGRSIEQVALGLGVGHAMLSTSTSVIPQLIYNISVILRIVDHS